MKLKNISLLVLMICLFSLTNLLSADFSLLMTHDSRYIFDGIDFAGQDDAAVDIFGVSMQEKNLGGFVYVAITPDYFEWGLDLNYTFELGQQPSLKPTFFPFGWTKHKETNWGAIFSIESPLHNSVAPLNARYAYAHIPELKELNGHYFYLGVNKKILGFDTGAGPNYNQGYITGDNKGVGEILGISKSIELSEQVFLDAYFKYYINHPSVNEDEQVIGATLVVKL